MLFRIPEHEIARKHDKWAIVIGLSIMLTMTFWNHWSILYPISMLYIIVARWSVIKLDKQMTKEQIAGQYALWVAMGIFAGGVFHSLAASIY